MSSNNSEKYFILSVLFALYIIISYLVFVVVRIGTEDSMFAALCFGVITVLLCGGTLHIYCKLNSMVPKSDRKRIKHETADKAESKVDEEVQEAVEVPLTSADAAEEEQPTASVPDTAVDSDVYHNTIEAHELARQKELIEKTEAIMEYLKTVMPPYMPQDQLELLCKEVSVWISNPEYLPETGVHAYEEFTTLDARHLIYNVAARLDKNHGGHTRSWFVKKIFAETCKDLEESGIYKNIKLSPKVGNIKIDEPDNGSFAFHYDLPEE